MRRLLMPANKQSFDDHLHYSIMKIGRTVKSVLSSDYFKSLGFSHTTVYVQEANFHTTDTHHNRCSSDAVITRDNIHERTVRKKTAQFNGTCNQNPIVAIDVVVVCSENDNNRTIASN